MYREHVIAFFLFLSLVYKRTQKYNGNMLTFSEDVGMLQAIKNLKYEMERFNIDRSKDENF